MNAIEIKEQLKSAGATEEQLAKIDFDKIESTINNSSNLDELCKGMEEAIPCFDKETFLKTIEEQAKNSADSEVLSEEQLETVAGGSIGSWLKDHWVGIAIVGACAAGMGIYGYYAPADTRAEGAIGGAITGGLISGIAVMGADREMSEENRKKTHI